MQHVDVDGNLEWECANARNTALFAFSIELEHRSPIRVAIIGGHTKLQRQL